MKSPLPTHRMKLARKKKGWSRADLGQRIGRTELMIGKYERWEKVPPLQIIGALVGIFDGALSFDDFIHPHRRIGGVPADPHREEASAQSHQVTRRHAKQSAEKDLATGCRS